MARQALHIDVSNKDRKELRKLLSGGVQQVRVTQASRKIAHRYREGGLHRALYEKQRPGAASVLDARQKQRVIAMVCSNPPDGFARWTVRLVAEEAVKRKLVPGAGRETIRLLLSHHDLRPWREKNVVVRRNLTMNT